MKVSGKIRYNPNCLLGRGVQGEVYQGEWNPTGFKTISDRSKTIECAIKVYPLPLNKNDPIYTSLKRELDIMGEIDHPNITKFYGHQQSSDKIYLAYELCSEMDFEKYLAEYGPLDSETDAARFFN